MASYKYVPGYTRDFIGYMVMSTPEPKAQVSFSDRNLFNRNLFNRNLIEICLIEIFLIEICSLIEICMIEVFLKEICPLSVVVVVVNFLHFLSSSTDPLGQFQPNLAQNIMGWWRGLNFLKREMFGDQTFSKKIVC